MIELPEKIKSAVNEISRLPGVGRKSALRQVMNILKWERNAVEQFSQNIIELSSIQYCKECNLFCENDICTICSNSLRQNSALCVVEGITDLIAIENSGTYSGKFFILGGVLNPLAGIGPEDIKIDVLTNIIKTREVRELILAVNPSVEGDATCSFIKSLVDDSVSVERIGFGIPIGGNLEYLDPLTISKALENKRRF
ncbi:recombination mediator RecR [Bacteriovoracaceae bacterium]|nr:recombination mediator RecR [Bacteriovoracaceae bacterium]